MKRIAFIMAVIVSVLVAATANAATYTVQKGDCLSKIAKKFHISWPTLYKANKANISNPDLIYVGQELLIPEKGSGKAIASSKKPFIWKKGGANPYGKKRSPEKAIALFNLPVEVKQAFVANVKAGKFEAYRMYRGQVLEQQIFGRCKLKENVQVQLPDKQLGADFYPPVEYGGKMYFLIRPYCCFNWSWWSEKMIGEIEIVKTALDINGNAITPVPEFSFQAGEKSVKTDESGHATISGLKAGKYIVTETVPEGWEQTKVTPEGGLVELIAGQSAKVEFVNRQIPPPPPSPPPLMLLLIPPPTVMAVVTVREEIKAIPEKSCWPNCQPDSDISIGAFADRHQSGNNPHGIWGVGNFYLCDINEGDHIHSVGFALEGNLWKGVTSDEYHYYGKRYAVDASHRILTQSSEFQVRAGYGKVDDWGHVDTDPGEYQSDQTSKIITAYAGYETRQDGTPWLNRVRYYAQADLDIDRDKSDRWVSAGGKKYPLHGKSRNNTLLNLGADGSIYKVTDNVSLAGGASIMYYRQDSVTGVRVSPGLDFYASRNLVGGVRVNPTLWSHSDHAVGIGAFFDLTNGLGYLFPGILPKKIFTPKWESVENVNQEIQEKRIQDLLQ